ncbi:hypothetical protein BCR44DRAFT_38879 [Catenaria anguillulae PL171]|uniref:Ankyrin repeat-containing domain protein n=1 Tax=Catenaria anguillulae PL171 TaxID=765915 RepID=A0A1Y2H8Q9_9FUNG|nr:hypothetical protein BCR44DRAFT_38879 [Catenaria anguillulae PL171]
MNAVSMNPQLCALATTASPPPPPLTVELAEPILAICVHLVAAFSLWQPKAIARPLNVLSRTHAPLVTKAALMNLPDIDLTWATERGDVKMLEFMRQWSKQPKGRPINYLPAEIVPLSLRLGSSAVLDWWLDESGLIIGWDWADEKVAPAFIGDGNGVKWFEWWKSRGLPHLDDPTTFGNVIVQACRQGRVDVLDWVLETLGPKWIVPEADHVGAIKVAAEAGHVHILDWWMSKSRAGLIVEPDFRFAFSEAIREHHVALLEWCKQIPQVIGVLRQERLDKVRPKLLDELVYPDAVRNGLLDWFPEFDLIPYKQELNNATVEACKKGDLDLVKQMHANRHLAGSWACLFKASIVSGNLEMLDWLHSTCGPSNLADAASSLFREACRTGKVGILDWLVANGYLVPDSDHEPRAPRRVRDSRRRQQQIDERHVPSPLGDVLLLAVHYQHVPVLDWLVANGAANKVSDQDLGECLVCASEKGYVDVLDWFARNLNRLSLSLHSIGDLPVTFLARALKSATKECHLYALDWWLIQLTSLKVDFSRFDCAQTAMLYNAFFHGRADIVDWWLHKSGPLKRWFDLGYCRPYLAACRPNWDEDGLRLDPIKDGSGKHAAQLSALNVWLGAKQPMDLAKCIHEASTSGRIDVLDWLLKVANPPTSSFAESWTSSSFPQVGSDDDDDPYYEPLPESATHERSLLWWRANFPEICCMPVNRGPYTNPIHAYMLEHMLRNTSFSFIRRGSRCLSALEYQRNTVALRSVDVEQCLIEASQWGGPCHVLEWWKRELGNKLTCPKVIVCGDKAISARAKRWWAKSGLVSEEAAAQIKTNDY